MAISYDPAKRDRTLRERKLDFANAPTVFAGTTFDREDDRMDYGETRVVSAGTLNGRMVVLVWTPRGAGRHIISIGEGR